MIIEHKFFNERYSKIANLCNYIIDHCISADKAEETNAKLNSIPLDERGPFHYRHYVDQAHDRLSVWRLAYLAYKEAVKLK